MILRRIMFVMAAVLAVGFGSGAVRATPTENYGIQVLPAPGKVTVDGKFDDWDLSGSLFASNDIETQRDNYAVWLSSMYDADNLYILARFKDITPENNPGQTIADYGWDGDCLQVRFYTGAGTPQALLVNVTAWKGRDGRDVINLDYPHERPGIADAKQMGAQQAFTIDADGKGYTQEIAIPWKLITPDGSALTAGQRFQMTFEPNFTVGRSGRLSIKDCFKPNMTLDRVFTFRATNEWGEASLEAKGHVPLRPVHAADGREFPVSLQGGIPVVDWTGVVREKVIPGFKTISFDMPGDGNVSLNIANSQGQVVCQLLRGNFYTKGTHTVQWDGLTTPNASVPGQPLPAGDYKWTAIYNAGLGLKLRGWADNGGTAPWDNGPATNWGGDEGKPTALATDANRVYIGWGCAEAAQAMLVTDNSGNTVWRNKHGGIAGASQIAVDADTVYVYSGIGNSLIYKMNPKTGEYKSWDGTQSSDLALKSYLPATTGPVPDPAGMTVVDGKILLAYTDSNTILALDGGSGKLLTQWTVAAPGRITLGPNNHVYVLSGGTQVLSLNASTGATTVAVSGLVNAAGLAVDAQGNYYVGVGDPDNQIKVFDPSGKALRTIGAQGGRPLLGPWVTGAFRFIAAMAFDSAGKLWVTEADDYPKRVSIWDAGTGTCVKEMFGATHYGASGGAIDPTDPNIMVGVGCEWHLDPLTGRSTCAGVFDRDTALFALFCIVHGRTYVAEFLQPHASPTSYVRVFERLAPGQYALRAIVSTDRNTRTTTFWSDKNGDGVQQPEEVTTVSQYMPLGSIWWSCIGADLSLASTSLVHVSSYTKCDAPVWDTANMVTLPEPGYPSPDGKLVLGTSAHDGTEHGTFDCMDASNGQIMWTYPLDFFHVHGSHNAPGPEPGLIRGAFGVIGSAQLPSPIGAVWAINTNVSEWHLLTQSGFYLGRLFNPDPLSYQFPDAAVPGAEITNMPPGLGGEDFGGSMTQGADGKMYVQAGKTAFWNLEVTGLDTIRPIPGGAVTLSDADAQEAIKYSEDERQGAIGQKTYIVHKLTPRLTGNVRADFKGADPVTYSKGDTAKVTTYLAWDDQNLYLAYDVTDTTPWVNGSNAVESLYTGGDTVDFQVGVDPAAKANRAKAVLGDERLSIGPFEGTDTAVLYQFVSNDKHPMTFHSGVVTNYPVDSVRVLSDATIKTVKRNGAYVVEAAIPLADLGLHAADGVNLTGDFGATFGDPGGQRTRLRVYWNNQHTGIVDDAVFELMLEPQNWGKLQFGE